MGDVDEVIVRAKALLDGITPGPWKRTPWHDRTVMPRAWADEVGDPLVEERGPFAAVTATGDRWAADAEFIAAAPSLVADLVAALEASRGETTAPACADPTDVETLIAHLRDPRCAHCDRPILCFPNHDDTADVWVHADDRRASCRVEAAPDALWLAAAEALIELGQDNLAPSPPVSPTAEATDG